MRNQVLILLTSVVFSGAAYSAKLIPESGVRLLVVNEETSEFLGSSFDIEPGKVQAVVRMSESVGRGSKKRVFDSEPYIITFTAGDSDVHISAPEIYSYEQAVNLFKKGPTWGVTSNGRPVDHEAIPMPLEDGFMPNWKLDRKIKAYNENHNIYFGTEAAIAAKAKSASVTASQNVATGNSAKLQGKMINTDSLDQLKAWYLKSSKEERKEFRRWMIDQE
ncbi:DUF2057 family protein [Vibrio hannami]|uniref:DUF2057 family protein n=1 Tax=Vibrio hannami TaxID=2717094 RepID=UPI0024102991|nr:DUF2057 family protein [Vibrio hannami]MDG3087681.1 DUF2057 family protein [Vibrio hannami]